MYMSEAFIVAAARTAGGRRGGRLSSIHPADLAACVLDHLVTSTGADPSLIEDVILGCVGQAGQQSQNIARNAVLSSSLPESVPATTVDRQCGSSQQAIHFAAQAVMSGSMDIVIAGGVESMSRVPMFTPSSLAEKAGLGTHLSEKMAARYPGVQFSQFIGAEMLATKYDLSKDELDQFAFESHRKAIAATQAGEFAEQIVPIATSGSEPNGHRVDEGIRFDASLEGIRSVKLLTPNGRLTAASASQICDGASGVIIANGAGLRKLDREPLARIRHMTVVGHDPVIMLEGPIPGTERALKKTGMTIGDIDLYEVNEAFASVPLSWLRSTRADPARLNVNGGAIALGHPLGASGAKLMTTLIYALRRRDVRFGLLAMCEGGGLANVTIVERL
jgi:acetyl-CoA C-acetyltransferase